MSTLKVLSNISPENLKKFEKKILEISLKISDQDQISKYFSTTWYKLWKHYGIDYSILDQMDQNLTLSKVYVILANLYDENSLQFYQKFELLLKDFSYFMTRGYPLSDRQIIRLIYFNKNFEKLDFLDKSLKNWTRDFVS